MSEVRRLELELAAAKEQRQAWSDKCGQLGQKLRWARVRAGVYQFPGAALEDALQRSGEVTQADLVELLGCGYARACSILYRAHHGGRLRRVRRGVYARAKR